jgi:[CysO sulfur-carrier protein]-S-L-cysteine hydrolase
VIETPSGAANEAPEPLEIPADILEAMVAHCRQEAPLECCGILGGVSPRVSSIHSLRNTDASPVRYNADPRDLIDAVVALRDRGAEILAIYHSHPKHPPIPSATDLRKNYYDDMPRIIVSLLGPEPEVRVWRLDLDSYEELPWNCVKATRPPGVEPQAPGG